ncbi:MAG: hypothetical protein EBU26_17250, partial [Verrucomicrobia bacterium]|nr:hypothetical protein [Verrucomicrobiota bacterium]
SDVGVAEVAAQMMAVTGPSEGDGFNFAQSQLRSGGLFVGATATSGLAGMLLPEFKEFDAAEVGISSNPTTSVECSVEMFDGTTPTGLSVSLLQYDNTLDEFAVATQTDNATPIDFTTSDNQTFTASNVPTQREYAIRFKIDSYRNDLPELFFWADEFSTQIDVCGPEGFVIGPDVEDKPLPGAGLFASSSTTEAEGLDFSNYTEPGKYFVLFPGEDGIEGTRDLMLIGTSGGSFSLELGGTEMKIAVVNKDSSGDLILAQDLTQSTNLSGIHTLLGQSLSSLLGTNFSGSSRFSLQPDNYGGLGGQVLLLKVSDKEYWLLELHYLDTEIGILELAFAKVSAQGRAEIPEAGFEQGPVDTEKSGGIDNHFLMYGDGLCLSDLSTSDTTLACNDEQLKFAFDFDGSVADIDDGVHLRYAGDDFFENIETLDDLEAYFNDASSIPVRLDGRGSTTFVKLSYDKQKRSYTMSAEASSATALEHNDLIGVCLSGNMESSACPDYVFRVVRMAPEDDLYANMFLELQSIRFSTPALDDDYRKQVIGEKSDYPNFPELSDNGTVAT